MYTSNERGNKRMYRVYDMNGKSICGSDKYIDVVTILADYYQKNGGCYRFVIEAPEDDYIIDARTI